MLSKKTGECSSGADKFQTRRTTKGSPSASVPKTDKQTGRRRESRNTMMRMSPQQDTGEVLAGLVERVTYHNAEKRIHDHL